MAIRISSAKVKQTHATRGAGKPGSRPKNQGPSNDGKAAFWVALKGAQRPVKATPSGAQPSHLAAAAWPCPPQQPVGCKTAKLVQSAKDLQRQFAKAWLYVEGRFIYAPLAAGIDTALFPDGLSAKEVDALERRRPGIGTVLRLAAPANPVAGLAMNVPRHEREKAAKAINDYYLGWHADRADSLGVGSLARTLMQQPYTPSHNPVREIFWRKRELRNYLPP